MTSDPPRRPQLTGEELQHLKWLLGGLLTLLGVGTVFYMDVDAWTLMSLTGLATLATMLWPTLPGRLPPLVHTLAFPVIVAFFAADIWVRTEVLPAMVRLDILLLLYRNITYRQRRDDLQIIVLGLFLVVVAGVLTVSLTFAAQILVYTACALTLLLVVTVSEAGASPGPRAGVDGPPAWAQHADGRRLFRRLRAVLDWRVAGLGVALFAGVVAVSTLLFLAIPRFQLENSMFLDRFISKKAKTGFSDTIRIGDVTEIQQDNALALSVDVSDQSAIPVSPYWRMLVLDVYENGSFRFSYGLKDQELEPERTSAVVGGYARARRGPAVQWTFFLESGVSRYLPNLGHFEALRFREAQNFRFAPRLAVIALRDEPVSMTAYRVEGFDLSPLLPDPVFAHRWRTRHEPSGRRMTLQTRLPAFARDRDRETLQRVVAQATGGAALAAPEFARQVGAWLKRTHAYSLTPDIPSGEGDPLVRWLESRAAGHCELFAGSFVLLARAAGFPARVVTGFRGGSWNGYSNNFTIRNADAHAWAEIFDEDAGGWLRADPLAVAATTEADGLNGAAAAAARIDRSWTARLDSLRVFWYRRIVSFDQRSQAETLKAVGEATRSSGRKLREALDETGAAIRAWLSAPWDLRRWLQAAAVVGFGGGMIVWWRRQGRAWWRGWAGRRGPGGADPVRREAGRWLRLRSGAEAAGAEAARLTQDLQRLRFGPRATWPEPAGVFRRARRAAREARRGRIITPP